MRVAGSIISLMLVSQLSSVASSAPAKWDYVAHPVKVTENRPAPSPVLGMEVASAFDGFGAQGTRPAAVRAWNQAALPTAESPISCEIDYGKPVQVTAFMHYFYTPESRDLRYNSTATTAFRRVRISMRNDDGQWIETASLPDLPVTCPQVLPTGADKPARYWRIEVEEMAPGAEALLTYEIETYTGGIPSLPQPEPLSPDFKAQFAKRMQSHKPSSGEIQGTLTLARDGKGLDVSIAAGETVRGSLTFIADGQPLILTPAGTDKWRTSTADGTVLLTQRKSPMGALMQVAFNAKDASVISHRRISARLTLPKVDLFYIPAYVWAHQPSDALVNSANVQTRMASLAAGDTVVSLVPGTDRGALGFVGGSAQNDMIVGASPTPLLVTATRGDWWSAYRFATDEIYGFTDPVQSVPVSEMQYGVSRYLLRDDIWEPALGTLRSWPPRDPHFKLYSNGFDAFQFYGVPYSVPAYWGRYVMNGDQLALDRCRSIIKWMCTSGIRMKDGPTKGAFFNSQRFTGGGAIDPTKLGITQAAQQILTSQSTGSALWTLIYYRKVSGDHDPVVDEAIDQAADWLLKTQSSDGSWPYAHDLDAKVVAGASSSGAIWNIWGLWRFGKETGDKRYLDAAERGKTWFARYFVREHHYHGYWEDVGPGSREGYDAAIAAVVFGDMGDKALVVETARDAMQWVFTRRIEPREANNSAGLVAEQTGWPPASYCNPMMGLAAATAWRVTGDDSWRPFAMIPKATGWWYQPETGAMVWIVDSTQMAPVVGPAFESWWSDWCIAQPGAYCLRWLVREVDRVSRGAVSIDEETLIGKALGREVRAWAPTGGLHPILPKHGQANWLGFTDGKSVFVVFMNYAESGDVCCHLDSRAAHRREIAPKAVYRMRDGKTSQAKWSGEAVNIPRDAMVIMEWELK